MNYIPASQGATNKFINPHNSSPVICASCNKCIARKGRTQRYCARCRDRGRERSWTDFLSQGTGAPARPHKSAGDINVLQAAKPRPTPYANDPLNIVGGGSFRWPETPGLDTRTLKNILRSEIGAAPASEGIWLSGSHNRSHEGWLDAPLSHKHKSRPKLSDNVHRAPDVRTHTRQNVLFDNEKWLDGRNVSPRVSQDEIQILEFGMDRLVYKVIVAMVFMLRCECMLPMRVASQLMA